MTLVEIGQETGLLWMPAKALLGQSAGRRAVEGEDPSQKAEVAFSLAEWHRRNRKVEVAANDACNVAHRDGFVADGVQPGACWRAFQSEAEQARRIETMHGGPAVRSVTWITRHTLRTRGVDQIRG